MSVGTVIEPYSQDKSFSVFGFGGIPKFLNNKSVNHCFPVNGNYQSAKIFGIQAVKTTYLQTLPMIELAGPTYCAPVLEEFYK